MSHWFVTHLDFSILDPALDLTETWLSLRVPTSSAEGVGASETLLEVTDATLLCFALTSSTIEGLLFVACDVLLRSSFSVAEIRGSTDDALLD